MGEFEKDIRDIFVDLEVAIDTNQLWKGIERKLDKKDRKHPVWWFLIPLFLMPIIAYTLYTQTTDSNKNDSKLTSTNKSNIKQKTEKVKQYSHATNVNQNTINKNSENHNPSLGMANLQKDKYIRQNPIDDSGNIIEKSIVNTANKKANTENKDAVSKNTSSILDKNTRNFILNDNTKRLNFSILRLSNEINTLVSDRLFTLNLNNFKPTANKIKSIKTKSTWEKSLDIGIGFAFVNKYLNIADKSYTSYKNTRESTESYLEAINTNIAFNIKNKSGFFVSTGINYTQVDERFTSKDSTDLISSKDGVVKEITESDGTKTVIRSQKEVVKFIKWDKVIYNYYHFIDIPLSIGYSLDLHNWNFELSSGLSYNIAFAKRGQIIGLENYPVDISAEKLFKSNTGLSFISNFKVLYKFKNRLFYLEPNIKYNLKSITTSENPLEQKYFTYGIKIGSRFNF